MNARRPAGRFFIRAAAFSVGIGMIAACDFLAPDRPEFEARVSGAVEMEIVGAGGFTPHPGEEHWGQIWTTMGSTGSWNVFNPPYVSIGHDAGVRSGHFRLERDSPDDVVATLHFAYRSPGGYLERFASDSGYVEISSFTEERVVGHFRAWATHVATVDPPSSGLEAHAPAPDGDQLVIEGRFDAPPTRRVRTLSEAP